MGPKLYGFDFATGDVNYLDYGATWYREINATTFHFIRLINWEDTVGEREAKEVGAKYNFQLCELDISQLTEAQIIGALESCGNPAETDPKWCALACVEYGLHAPHKDINTSNFHKTFRELARYSRELSGNQWVHDQAMKRPVNRIGSTAAEFMRGDIHSAVERGVLKGNPAANLMAKLGM